MLNPAFGQVGGALPRHRIERAIEAPVFPPVYGMMLDYKGKPIDGYEDGDILKIDTQFLPDVDDLVCVHLRTGEKYVMHQELALHPDVWAKMPYREPAGSEIRHVFVGRVLGTEQSLSIAIQDCLAIHVVVGKVEVE